MIKIDSKTFAAAKRASGVYYWPKMEDAVFAREAAQIAGYTEAWIKKSLPGYTVRLTRGSPHNMGVTNTAVRGGAFGE